MDQEGNYTDLYKIILIGNTNVGKTALAYRFILDEVPPVLSSTVGVEFIKKQVIEKHSKSKIQLHIWDTAGQERFKSVTMHHYHGADGALLVYDVTCRESFDHVSHWLSELKENAHSDCMVLLLGNKIDLSNDNPQLRRVTTHEAQTLANREDLLFRETSALWNADAESGIQAIFHDLVSKIYSVQEERKDAKPTIKESELEDQEVIRLHGLSLDRNQLFEHHKDATQNKCGC